MMIATFEDGTRCRLGAVRGEGFDPKEGDTFLFEFPAGELKEGTVRVAAGPGEEVPVIGGIYDAESRTISVEV